MTNSQNFSVGKKSFFVVLALIAFTADIATIYSFIENKVFHDSWSSQWFFSIFFIFLFCAISAGLLIASGFEELSELFIKFYSIVYFIGAILIYVAWGLIHIKSPLNFGGYSGYFILFVLFFWSGIILSSEINMVPSLILYILGLANMGTLILMLNKYVFESVSIFFMWNFLGEVLIIVIGSGLFLLILED